MHDPSNDRAQPNERTEAPAIPEPGASLHTADESGDPTLRLRRLVHDLANWYQRMEAQLERLESGRQSLDELVQGLRQGLQACAQLGASAVGCELPGAAIPQSLLDFVAQDALSRPQDALPLGLESLGSASRSPAPATLALSVAQLQNILLNLVENARRALGPEGTVVLRWRLDEREVLLEVADRGAGMDSAGLEACTRPGYSTKPESGHGHGLSGAKDLVESVGGRFEVESGLGQGTTVRLWLPLRERSGRTPGGISGFASVLLIEDDPEVADVVRLFLESDGLRCEVRGSGRAAWNALATESFDLALVDQGLPDLPGLDLAEGIRQEHPDLVVVLLTGDPSVRREPIEGGPLDAVGLKPLDRAGLRALLEEAADHARNRASQDAPRRRPAHG